MTVVSTALITSLLGLAALTALRIERKSALRSADLMEARENARSAVEWALLKLEANSNWRSQHANGVETAPQSLGPNGRGTISYIFQDTDGSLTNADVRLRLRGVGRVGQAVQVSSITLRSSIVESVEQLFLQQDALNAGVAAEVNFKTNIRVAQSFQPAFPAQTESWKITRVAFLPRPHAGTDGQIIVSVREMAANGTPSATIIDQATALESGFVAGNWYEVTLANAGGLNPSKEHCIVLHASSGAGTIGLIKIGTTSLLTPGTRYFLDNGFNSWAENTTNDLWIKIWGAYRQSNGIETQIGSWEWDAAP